ncbi:hypothetical protein RHGRI_002211 [Rhododendron griersonianum]|uniref:Uncharacterized protein n=1 Tax=Rhododendron griersonianum TaxID=479676 RepID=A0AAV6LPB0_9ERIC|nr:hypothetical protein RHGRI_002211 [Rhododendron griersonianum]
MRQIASCIGEYAIQVSDHASCSTSSTHSWISPSVTPSTQTSVSCLYKTTLMSNQKHLLITVTWTRTHTTQGLTITFGPNPPQTSFKLNTSSGLFRKKKGAKQLEAESSKIDLSWDLSAARYNAGPEPTDGFHVTILVDSELALALGNKTDVSKDVVSAKTSLVSRREYFSGNTLYMTKARFCEGGVLHDVLIHCGGENDQTEGSKGPVLSVCVDKKTVVKVKRLQWNFRGNQMVFVDGLLVDMMWDVHDWFFGGGGGAAGFGVFMFRRRSGTESRLWLEEKVGRKEMQDKEKMEFSLVIYACKSP